MRKKFAVWILFVVAVAVALGAGLVILVATTAMPLHAQTPGVCDQLSCPALQDLCLKNGDQRACALHRLCC